MRLHLPAAALALFLAVPSAFAADIKTVSAELGALSAEGLAVDAPKVDAWLKATFTGDNACSDPGNPNLSFEQTCPLSSADSDEPAPDMIVGIKDGKIVSALTTTDDLKTAGWTCQATETDYRACFPASTGQAERDKLSAEWTAFLNSAG